MTSKQTAAAIIDQWNLLAAKRSVYTTWGEEGRRDMVQLIAKGLDAAAIAKHAKLVEAVRRFKAKVEAQSDRAVGNLAARMIYDNIAECLDAILEEHTP